MNNNIVVAALSISSVFLSACSVIDGRKQVDPDRIRFMRISDLQPGERNIVAIFRVSGVYVRQQPGNIKFIDEEVALPCSEIVEKWPIRAITSDKLIRSVEIKTGTDWRGHRPISSSFDGATLFLTVDGNGRRYGTGLRHQLQIAQYKCKNPLNPAFE